MKNSFYFIITFAILLNACSKPDEDKFHPKDPDKAEIVSVDRFGNFGTLMKRTIDSTLPGINEPVNFDIPPFITQGFGPDGKIAKYYNFDVQPAIAAPLYVFYKSGEADPVKDQLSVIDAVPGDTYYNDFWRIYKVTVPDNYIANSITSVDELYDTDYNIEILPTIVNCPIVPKGSMAIYSYNNQTDNELHRGWYKGKIVYYFTFSEKELFVNEFGNIPTSPIYVTFNINPDENNPLSGPASGNMKESGTQQTHNVVGTIPEDDLYSPFWNVNIYNNSDFNAVFDLNSAKNADILVENAVLVNCPIVYLKN